MCQRCRGVGMGGLADCHRWLISSGEPVRPTSSAADRLQRSAALRQRWVFPQPWFLHCGLAVPELPVAVQGREERSFRFLQPPQKGKHLHLSSGLPLVPPRLFTSDSSSRLEPFPRDRSPGSIIRLSWRVSQADENEQLSISLRARAAFAN